MSIGRIPPQAIDMETAVLGAVLIQKDAIDRIDDILAPGMMYKESHRIIYESCLALKAAGNPIDLLTVKDHLSSRGMLEAVGGMFYLIDITSKVASAANIEYHANVISRKHMMRELIKIGDNAVNSGFDETTDVFELYDTVQQSMIGLIIGTTGSMTHVVDDQEEGMQDVERAMKAYQKMQQEGGQVITGVPSGLNKIDELTCGFQPTDLIIVAARPSMGKTKFAVNITLSAAKAGVIVFFFSLEVSKKQMRLNMVSMKAGLNSRDVSIGNLSLDQLRWYNSAWEKMVGVHVDDRAAVDIGYIKRVVKGKIRKMDVNKNQKYMVVVDYLQLMTGENKKGGNREQEIASISRGLKQLAKDINSPIIALSQLSRSVETRGGNKKPGLSDLRESGSIEQDADIVMFLYRPEYYGLTTYEDGSSTHGIGEIDVAKQRNGPLGNCKFAWDPRVKGWYNLDEMENELRLPKIEPKIFHPGESRHSEEQPDRDDFFPF